jgi:hypothetical protein
VKPEDLPQRLMKTLLPRGLRLKANSWYKFRTADYLIVSYPKCGRTWLRVILSHYYVERYGLQSGILLDFSNLHYLNREIPKIFFTHDIPHTVLSPQAIGTDKSAYYKRKLVFLVRDPRDVIVSMYFQRTRRDANYQGSLLEFVHGDVGGLRTLIRYYNIWAENLPRIDAALLLKYEDMRSDTVATLSRLLDFMGHAADRDIARRAVEACSFDRMKEMERNKEYNRSWLKPGDVNDEESFKVRRGKIGGYADYLQGDELEKINQLIKQELAPVFGYR